MGVKWLLTSLSAITAKFLLTTLEFVTEKAYHLRILSQCQRVKRVPVFDLLNCGPRARFMSTAPVALSNCLALGYGMGPKRMVVQCKDKGYELDLKTARDFYKSYWDLFSGIRRLSISLGNRVKRDGYIVNPFGYRLTPNGFKALNFFIQSSVSGIMHVFNAKLFAIAPYSKFVTIIHDEVICDVPIDRIEDFRKAKEIATESLNEDLKWTVKIRTGFVFGGSWYEAK
jgi:hypothetical protein